MSTQNYNQTVQVGAVKKNSEQLTFHRGPRDTLSFVM